MACLSSFFGSQSRHDSPKDFHQISPAVQTHLEKVYISTCFALIAFSVGAYLHNLCNIGGVLTDFATLGCIYRLFATPPREEKKRVSLFMASSLFYGASIGPLIDFAIDVDTSILVTSIISTTMAFVCFSGVAMLAKRKQYLSLGGLRPAAFLILLGLHIASFFFCGSAVLFQVKMFFGLLVFVEDTMVDTQGIVEKARHGDLDYVNHALSLLIDFISVFLHILFLMNSAKNGGMKKNMEGEICF